MKFKKIVTCLAGLGAAAAISAPAYAGYVVLDGWEMDVTSGSSTTVTTGIGRLNLVSGSAIVDQQVDSSGNVFAGAAFRESGTIYSISYTKENTVGAGDSGAPTNLPGGLGLTISFSPVTGFVTNVNPGGGFKYVFTSGSFSITDGSSTLSTGSVVGIGGNAGATNVIGGINGDSTILALLATLTNFTLKDNLGVDLLPSLLTGSVLFESVTNNNTTKVLSGSTPSSCSFDGGVTNVACVNLQIASAGDAYLVRDVAEPGTLALLGLGLLGAGAIRRRNRVSSMV